MQGDAGICREVQGGAGRCREVQGGGRTCRELQGRAGRWREEQGGGGRRREEQGAAAHRVAHHTGLGAAPQAGALAVHHPQHGVHGGRLPPVLRRPACPGPQLVVCLNAFANDFYLGDMRPIILFGDWGRMSSLARGGGGCSVGWLDGDGRDVEPQVRPEHLAPLVLLQPGEGLLGEQVSIYALFMW